MRQPMTTRFKQAAYRKPAIQPELGKVAVAAGTKNKCYHCVHFTPANGGASWGVCTGRKPVKTMAKADLACDNFRDVNEQYTQG